MREEFKSIPFRENEIYTTEMAGVCKNLLRKLNALSSTSVNVTGNSSLGNVNFIGENMSRDAKVSGNENTFSKKA